MPRPSEKALRDLRRRLGPAPMKALFEVVAGPLAQPRTPGVCYAGLRTIAVDGCNSLKVPDTDRNRSWLGRMRSAWAGPDTPRCGLMTLVETGTRGLLGATVGSAADRDEATVARRLLPLLHPGMLVLLDRAFDANGFLAAGRCCSPGAGPTATRRYSSTCPTAPNLSCLDGRAVRIIEADLTMTGADGSRGGDRYRLITTLLGHRHHPADALARLYHERWETETAYLALRHTLLNGHVLRSGNRAGVEQEIWALLTLYQLLRKAMVTAVESGPGTDPDRASFTSAMEAARDALTAARGVCPDPAADPFGAIGRAVLATLLPARRPRFSARKVKCATFRYLNRDDGRPHTVTAVTAINITVRTPALGPRLRRTRATPSKPRPPQPPTRRDLITAIITSQPPRAWSGHELPLQLQIKPRNLLTQLGEGARLGFFTRTSFDTHALNTPPSTTSSTTAPDPYQ